MKNMDRRFVSLGRLIKQAIIEDDVFGLIEPKHTLVKIINVNADTPGKEAFKFSTSQDKVSQFMKWLKEQERKGLLNTTTINTSGTPIEKAWTDQYIQDSYKRGVTRARYEMGAAGMGTPGIEETGGISASMSTPFHMDRVGMLYARTFEDLIGITAQMDSAISRILSQGMVDGDGPRSLAGKIVDATGVSRRRAMTLTRTEIIRAHHSAMVQEYKNWAVEGVVVKAEWVTAGFNVCPECLKLEKGGDNGVYSLNEIEGMIPAHPNCRCMALPTMPEKGVKTIEKVQESVNNVWKGVADLPENQIAGTVESILKEAQIPYQRNLSHIWGSDYWTIGKQRYRIADHAKPSKEMFTGIDVRSHKAFVEKLQVRKDLDFSSKTEMEKLFKASVEKDIKVIDEVYYDLGDLGKFNSLENAEKYKVYMGSKYKDVIPKKISKLEYIPEDGVVFKDKEAALDYLWRKEKSKW
jgi:hypothetical protein